VPDGDYTVPIGKAAVRRAGKDLTIVTCGGMVLKADACLPRN
jgi:pyruvate dehydrogenase E1 component beta subunit